MGDGDRDLSKLHGDQLTWALDARNQVRWNRLEAVQKVVLALLVILLSAQLTGFHVTPDPTLHIPLQHLWGWG